MLIVTLALLAAAAYVVYKFIKTTKSAVVPEVEQGVQAVEAAVKTDVATAQNAVSEIKAKL